MTDKKKKETALAKQPQEKSGVPAPQFDYGQDAKRGWQNTGKEDFKVPFLNLIQNTSDEIVQGDPKFIEGAEPGLFFNSVSRTLYPGKEIFLVPCLTKHHFTEWAPRGKGSTAPLGQHAIRSDVVKQAKIDAGSNWKDLKTPEGNILEETYEIYGLRLDDPADKEPAEMVVISFTKTKIKRYQDVMTTLRSFKGSGDVPLFAHRLRMTSTDEKGDSGPYKNVRLEPAIEKNIIASMIPHGTPLYASAAAFEEMLSSGEAQADYASVEKETSAAGTRENVDDIL